MRALALRAGFHRGDRVPCPRRRHSAEWLAQAHQEGWPQTTVSFNSMLFSRRYSATGLHPRRARDFLRQAGASLPAHPGARRDLAFRQVMQLLGAKVGRHLEVGNTRLTVAGELGQSRVQGSALPDGAKA